MGGVNLSYLQTNRGIIKIVQIVIGIILSGMMCGTYYGCGHCFGEGRLGYTSGLNFVVLIINIVLLVLNLLDLAVWKMKRIYSIVCCILFLISFILLIWFLIAYGPHYGTFIVGTILIFVMFATFVWDVKILQGEASNH